jgi:hypothetical protein
LSEALVAIAGGLRAKPEVSADFRSDGPRVHAWDWPEKAGVGGSTPSLATIIISKQLAELRLAVPVRSVRRFSARSGSVPVYDDGERLKLELCCFQSAFSPLLSAAWLKIAVSIAPAAAMRSSLTLWV